MTIRNAVHFTRFSAPGEARIEQVRIYYRSKRLTVAGAERMLRTGRPIGDEPDYDRPNPLPNAIVSRVEAILDLR